MSDQFNHFHYLDKKLINEDPKEIKNFNFENFLIKRKNQFSMFNFIVSKGNNILYSDNMNGIFLTHNGHNGIKFNSQINSKIFWLKIHEQSTNSEDVIYLNNNTTFIHEDINIQKSQQNLNIISSGNNYYYYLNNHISEQLFLNNIQFELSEKLHTYFIVLNNLQRHKNKTIYNLKENSELINLNFSSIQIGQMQDDSIECIHDKNSKSKIYYESLNSGKISTQVNSIINNNAFDCEIQQKIKHICLHKNAVTNSKPNLIIENPQVLASHGNSIGSFNTNDLFYLEQRGLSKQIAYETLSNSILHKFIEQTTIPKELFNYIKG